MDWWNEKGGASFGVAYTALLAIEGKYFYELAGEGARRMLVEALEPEVAEYIGRHTDERDAAGRAHVVHDGVEQK